MIPLKNIWPRKRWDILAGAVLLLAVAIPWALSFNTAYFVGPDAFDYAQMGREIRNGHGMATLQILPRHVPYMKAKGLLDSSNWPNLYRYPLTPLLNAVFQGVISDPSSAAVLQTGVWFLISIPVLFYLARALTNLGVACVTTIFYAADPQIYRFSYNGMTESVATLLLLMIFLVAFAARSTRWKWASLGFLTGLAYLARTQLLLLLPFALLCAFFSVSKSERKRAAPIVFAVFCLTILPWLGRNLLLTGDPVFSFSSSRNLVLGALVSSSDLDMQLHAPVSTTDIIGQYGEEIREKFLGNVSNNLFTLSYWDRALPLWPPFLLLFVISLGRRENDSRDGYQVFKFAVLGLLLCNFFLTSLTLEISRFYLMFHPLIILVATHTLIDLISRVSKNRARLVTVASVIVLLSVGLYRFSSLVSKHRSAMPNSTNRQSFESLISLSNEDDVFASDGSRFIAFYAARRAVRLPGKPQELIQMDESYLPIDYVLITRRVLQKRTTQTHQSQGFETFAAYRDFVQTSAFQDRFRFVAQLENGAILFKKRARAARD